MSTGDPFRDAFAENTTAPELRQLADRLADARVRLEEIEDAAKKQRSEYEALESQLFDALENAGIRQVRTDRGLFGLNDLAWASIEDPEKARLWADREMPELLTLNLQRLSKIVRDTLKGEREGPMPDGVGFKTSRKITWRRQ